MMSKRIIPSLLFLLAAALLRFWMAPLTERLPASYARTEQLTEENQFRDSPDGEWQAGTLAVKRMDQAMYLSGNVALIQGSLQIYFASGTLNFETSGLYGVDRRTRLNLPGYGNVSRNGQYLFPPHVQRRTYPLWDAMFIGPRQAAFDHDDTVEGLKVYVFQFEASGLDETEGYSYLADVPERYLAHTDGSGWLWIEPVSGVVVDYEDGGVSYFVDAATGERLADFNQWTKRYTPETRLSQLALARANRLRILALEAWLSGGMALIGLLWLGVGLFILAKARRLKKSGIGASQ